MGKSVGMRKRSKGGECHGTAIDLDETAGRAGGWNAAAAGTVTVLSSVTGTDDNVVAAGMGKVEVVAADSDDGGTRRKVGEVVVVGVATGCRSRR